MNYSEKQQLFLNAILEGKNEVNITVSEVSEVDGILINHEHLPF